MTRSLSDFSSRVCIENQVQKWIVELWSRFNGPTFCGIPFWFKIRLCRIILGFYLALFGVNARAECDFKTAEDQQADWGKSEVALANLIIYSQENIPYFFSDNNSWVRPEPATGLGFFYSYPFGNGWQWSNALSLPLREEVVYRGQVNKSSYYFPKLFMSGLEKDIYSVQLTSKKCMVIHSQVGLSMPLSPLLGKYWPPYLLMRVTFGVSSDAFLNIGIGYSGNINRGAWFFPFGLSYVLR